MTELTLRRGPGLDPLAIIAGSDLADGSKRKYAKALEGYLDEGNNLGDSQALASYAQGLKPSRKAHLKAAVKMWADQVAQTAKGKATPENIGEVLATVARAEAITEAIKVKQTKGTKAHEWLSKKEVRKLSNAIGNGIQGDRDRALVGLMVAAGLRREEVVRLRFEDIKTQEVKGKTRTVLEIQGKGDKSRVVPISDKLAQDLKRWGDHVGHIGKVARRFETHRTPGDSLSSVALFNLVRKYGEPIGKPELAPHDLRRTFAQQGFDAGVPITQLSVLLGHATIATTQRYLNLELDLETTASDFVPW